MGRQSGKRTIKIALAATLSGVTAAGLLSGCGGDPQATRNQADNAANADSARGPQAAGAHAECPTIKPPVDSPARQVRGMWIATISNVDWPRDTDQPAARQKADYRRLLDQAKALNLNAVYVQVRPGGDAFYRSPYEPWSQWLTGTPGKDPGYDVLRFLVDEAHARDLEFHAWFNPYRVSQQDDLKKLSPASPARKHPDWVVRYGGGLWYDPGRPQVRDLVTDVVLDVVRKYDIDGVHFDDYFYPYPSGGRFGDQATYKAYGKGQSLASWRRGNVDTLVRTLSQRIRQTKSWVQFGISPFGVWRNSTTDKAGSRTKALQSYDDIYADSRKWVREGWLDYITPQLYWPIGDSAAEYRTLVAWWSRQVAGTKVQLTIGQAAYRVGEDKVWKHSDELSRHLSVNAGHREVRGDVFFSAVDMMRNKQGFAGRVRKDHYTVPAILPVPAARGGRAPAAPQAVTATAAGGAVRVKWHGSGATSYAVYRVNGKGAQCAAADPSKLLGTVRANAVLDSAVKPGATYTYYVTALDRLHHESAPARGAAIAVRGG